MNMLSCHLDILFYFVYLDLNTFYNIVLVFPKHLYTESKFLS